MRTKFAIALAIVAVCVTAAWAGWDPEFQITDNRSKNSPGILTRTHYAAIGEGGVVHLVWYISGADADDVYYKRYWPGNGWSEELKIGEDLGGVGACPGIALDANGRDIHVVWRSSRTFTQGKGKNKIFIQDATFYYWKCEVTGPGTGGWVGDPTDLCVNFANGYTRWWPDIACGAGGQVVVVWQEGWDDPSSPLVYSVVLRECLDGEWQDEQVIAGPTEDDLWAPTIAADDNGDVFVSYIQFPAGAHVIYGHVFVTRRVSGSWSLEDVTPEGDLFSFSAIEVSPITHHPHLLCRSAEIDGADAWHVYHTYSTGVQDGWEPFVMISDPAESEENPHLFFTGDGAAHAVWDGYDSDEMVYECVKYASCPSEGEDWSDPVWLSSVPTDGHDLYNPDIAGGTDGTLLAVWRRTEGTRNRTKAHIWGMYNTQGGDGGQAEPMVLSQSCFELVPNPARAGRVAVQYSLPRAGQMTVTLLDVSGRVVRTQEVSTTGLSGSFTLDADGLKPGVYVVKLESGTTSQTRKLVIH